MSVLSYGEALAALPALIAEETEGLSQVRIAIDGMSGAGKSRLARELAHLLGDAAIIETDHFYLPLAERTPERMAAPGWIMDHARFTEEIAMPILRGGEISYGVFDCHTQSIARKIEIGRVKHLIVEGCYAMHPEIPDFYDFRITLLADETVLHERIRERDGEAMLSRFVSEWLPLEREYLETYMVAELSDAVVDTGAPDGAARGFSGFSIDLEL